MLTTLETRDGAAWITVDDGKVNAMSLDMLREVSRRLDEARPLGVPVVLKGRPGVFSAGFDLKTFARGPEASAPMVEAGVSLIEQMLAFPRPIVTACTGHAYPMGAFLMLSADVRFGVAGDWRIGLNEVAIAITVPHFAIELARYRLTPSAVMQASTGAMFGPHEAARAGYLDHVVDAGDLDRAVAAEIQRLRAIDMKSYEQTKPRLNGPILAAIAAARTRA